MFNAIMKVVNKYFLPKLHWVTSPVTLLSSSSKLLVSVDKSVYSYSYSRFSRSLTMFFRGAPASFFNYLLNELRGRPAVLFSSKTALCNCAQ